ncbi:MAG TPA: fibronectin type III domain-containing protein [Phycisphaerae bacterium]|nr:fibronectin type III domain-containing protein [Phycisphaerae bacterium]
MTLPKRNDAKGTARWSAAVTSRFASIGRSGRWCGLLACILLACMVGPINAQLVAEDLPPVPTDAASAPAPAAAAECNGVGWPAGFQPAPKAVELPSSRLSAGAPALFPANRLAFLDPAPLLAEDATSQGLEHPPRVGIDQSLNDPVGGVWQDLPDGGRVWTAAVVSEGAVGMRLHFADVNLPSGAALYVYSPADPLPATGLHVEHGPRQVGELWSGSVEGDTARIEYYVADAGQATEVPFTIDRIGHMYRPLDGDGSAGPRSWDSCMQDVACYFPTWQNISYAVAKMTFSSGGSWYNCSGTLLATVNGDNTPYFLTSAHCIDDASEAASLECRWFYQRATCGGSFMTSQYSYVADLLATSGAQVAADWTLLMIRGALPSGVYWSGWTTTDPVNGSWAVTVHHPGGNEKRYSRGQSYGAGPSFNQIFFDVPGAVGAIYYGTSGSGIWTESGQQLYGNASYTAGDPGCDFLDSPAGYGRFSTYYSTISGYLAAGGDDSLEPDDTCATAAPVGAGSYPGLVVKRYGSGGSQGEDWYRLTVGHGSQLIVTLTFIDAYGDINAQLYNSCGGSVVASATGTGNGETLAYTNTGTTASFYLRVYLVDNPRNTYDMSIQGAFLDCNGNNEPDSCDISCSAPGCSGVPGCGQSLDCNGDGVPDECQGGDPCPPTNLHWVVPPTGAGTTSITMQAHADDPSGVEYYYAATGPGSHSRNWDANPVYTDTGLLVNRNYTYKVKARDQSPLHNETSYSDTVPAATFIETPAALTVDSVTDTSIQVTAPGTFTRLNQNFSGLYFEVTRLDGTPAGSGTGVNNWTQLSLSQTAVATGLSPGTTYRFRVKARNYYGVNETPWYPASGYLYQATTTPPSCVLLGDVNGDGHVNGLDVGGFVRAKLGAAPLPGENQACANYGGTLDHDIAAFVDDLLGQ